MTRKIKVLKNLVTKNIETDVKTFGELFELLKVADLIDSGDTIKNALERFRFSIPNNDASSLNYTIESSMTALPNEDFVLFINIKKQNQGVDLDEEFSILKENQEVIIKALENVLQILCNSEIHYEEDEDDDIDEIDEEDLRLRNLYNRV